MTNKEAIRILQNKDFLCYECQHDKRTCPGCEISDAIDVAILALITFDKLSYSGRRNGKAAALYSTGYRDGTINALHISADNVKKALTNEETIRQFEEFSKALNKIIIDAIGLEPPTKPE